MSVCSIVNITELIDRCPLRPLQIRVIVLCGLVALLDGLDLLAIGVAAPVMAGPLHIAPNQLGFVFSAALVGLMLGAFGLGPIADRYGRGCVLIYATATFGVFTLCTASAATLQQMLLFRFLAGVGLGGAMPSFISLAAEYTPRSNRQGVIGLLWTGFPLGGVMVGLLASRLINAVWLAVVVLCRRHSAARSVDGVDLLTARFDRVPGDPCGGLAGDSGSAGPDHPDH